MPSRVGHVTELYQDGTMKAVNEITNEEWFGRLVIGSGGMLMFDLVDERLLPANNRTMSPEHGEAPDSARMEPPSATRVKIGAGVKKTSTEE